MSIIEHIEHIQGTLGIVATAVAAPALASDPTLPAVAESVFRGDPKWRPVFDTSFALFEKVQQPKIRIVFTDHTLLWIREGEERVGVLFPTGHVVMKSITRRLRRMARRKKPARLEASSNFASPAI